MDDGQNGAWRRRWWLWVFAAPLACAGAGWVLQAVSGGRAVAVAAGVLAAPGLVVAAGWLAGWSVPAAESGGRALAVAGAGFGSAGWLVAGAWRLWPLAGALACAEVAAAAGAAAWVRARMGAGLSAALSAAAGLLAGAGLDPLAAGSPWRWAAGWLAGSAALAAAAASRPRRAPAADAEVVEEEPPVADPRPLAAAVAKHVGVAVGVVAAAGGEAGAFRVHLQLSGGRTFRQVAGVVEAVESELGLRPGAVAAERDPLRRDRVFVAVTPADPAAAPARRPDPPASVLEPVGVGRHDDGRPMLVRIFTVEGSRRMVVGGRSRSGKSSLVWVLLEGWTGMRDTVVFFADLSNGAMSAPWAGCLHWTVTTPPAALVMLAALQAVLDAREGELAGRGWVSWQPSAGDPAIVFVLDEAQRLLRTSAQAQAAVVDLMQRGGKSGVAVVLSAPDQTTAGAGVSPAMRGQADYRLCTAAMPSVAQWVFEGTPALAVAGVVAEFTRPGQVLGHGPDLAAVPGRAHPTDRDRAVRVAAAHAAWHPARLDPASEAAVRAVAGAAYPHPPATGHSPTGHSPTGHSPTGHSSTGPAAAAPAAGGVAPPPGPGVWTGADDAALATEIQRLAAGPGLLGRSWPATPLPDPAAGRLSQEQAMQVATALVAQPGGTTPQAVQKATGRSTRWAQKTLGEWLEEGVVVQPQHGRYATAGALSTAKGGDAA